MTKIPYEEMRKNRKLTEFPEMVDSVVTVSNPIQKIRDCLRRKK